LIISQISNKKHIMFDGAMGTMLHKAGLTQGQLPESYNITHPEIIREIHESYIRAGADIVTTNTFQANDLKLKHGSYSSEEVIQAGVTLAKESGAKYVALDIGPLGQLIEPTGEITFEEAYDLFARQIKVGAETGAHLILLETFSDLYEAKAAVLAAKENSSLPVICTMTFQKDRKTLLGTDPITATLVLQALGVDALGVNCSLGPKELIPIVEEILKYAEVPVIAQPNAGLPKFDGANSYYDLTPEEFAGYIKIMAKSGVAIFGGCCGTTPEYMMAAKKALSDLSPVKTSPKNIRSACSGRETVFFQGQTVSVGEINLGEEKFREALLAGNIRAIVSEAKKQQKTGAQVLKINIGVLEPIKGVLIKDLIKKLQRNIHIPFIFEGANVEAIESAIRVYNGKPLVNYF